MFIFARKYPLCKPLILLANWRVTGDITWVENVVVEFHESLIFKCNRPHANPVEPLLYERCALFQLQAVFLKRSFVVLILFLLPKKGAEA